MMPQGLGGLEDAKHLFIRGWLQRIEAAFTSAFEERLPRHLLLDEKMIWMKFEKDIIITCKAINGNKTFVDIRNMKNIV
jgi:hypothetical protein